MLDYSCQVQRHTHAERGLDLYETPAVAVEALLRVERLPHRIWEPACGRGAIVNVLRARGHEAVASDVADYGLPITPPGYYGRDFLLERKLPAGCECIVTNPPFMHAEKFVAHALGFILRRGDNVFEAFDRAERSLGVFKDQRSAADAISGEVAR